ncbi:MAG: hypothetical protein F4139_02710 [Gemmatimonadetes bacterium]|nr:hypothetical protein [Gemmatimonadota bacterium]MYH51843.1 hypothetical protein [Gemmatimonadota bacterium]MYK66306.1 hypothetical protein [Gemmatimonadota bacterium]
MTMSAELRARILVAAVGIPLALLLIHLGDWYLGALLIAAAALGANEFYALASAGEARPVRWLGIPAAAMLVLLAVHDPVFAGWSARGLALVMTLVLLTACAVVFCRRIEEDPLLSASATVLGALYTGGTLSFAVLLRSVPEVAGTIPVNRWEGTLLVLLPLAVTWAGDTAAFFVGRSIGKTRLAPRASPGKTVEGGIGGLAASTAAGVAAGFVLDGFGTFHVTPVTGGVIGLVLGAAAQVGDLAESVLKREAGVKDSGALLPGHGGVLDRLDSLYFTLPLAYGLLCLTRYLP